MEKIGNRGGFEKWCKEKRNGKKRVIKSAIDRNCNCQNKRILLIIAVSMLIPQRLSTRRSRSYIGIFFSPSPSSAPLPSDGRRSVFHHHPRPRPRTGSEPFFIVTLAAALGRAAEPR